MKKKTFNKLSFGNDIFFKSINEEINGVDVEELKVSRIKFFSPTSEEERKKNKKNGWPKEMFNYYVKLKNGKEYSIEDKVLSLRDLMKRIS